MIQNAWEMLKKLNRDSSGSYMVEMALVLIGVALTVYGAASGLANNAIVPQYDTITSKIHGVSVPDLVPTPAAGE